MKIATRFPIAVHTLLCIARYDGKERTTSDFIAASVNVNPVIVRQVLQKLKAAGLVNVARGAGGAHLAKAPNEITLLDILQAVDAIDGSLFALHDAPNPRCEVGHVIRPLLEDRLGAAQAALEKNLAQTALSDLLAEVEKAN